MVEQSQPEQVVKGAEVKLTEKRWKLITEIYSRERATVAKAAVKLFFSPLSWMWMLKAEQLHVQRWQRDLAYVRGELRDMPVPRMDEQHVGVGDTGMLMFGEDPEAFAKWLDGRIGDIEQDERLVNTILRLHALGAFQEENLTVLTGEENLGSLSTSLLSVSFRLTTGQDAQGSEKVQEFIKEAMDRYKLKRAVISTMAAFDLGAFAGLSILSIVTGTTTGIAMAAGSTLAGGPTGAALAGVAAEQKDRRKESKQGAEPEQAQVQEEPEQEPEELEGEYVEIPQNIQELLEVLDSNPEIAKSIRAGGTLAEALSTGQIALEFNIVTRNGKKGHGRKADVYELILSLPTYDIEKGNALPDLQDRATIIIQLDINERLVSRVQLTSEGHVYHIQTRKAVTKADQKGMGGLNRFFAVVTRQIQTGKATCNLIDASLANRIESWYEARVNFNAPPL